MSINKITACLLGSMLCFTTLTVFAGTKILANYGELLQALDSGNAVRAIAHLDKCKLDSGGGLVGLSGGINFDVFNHYIMPIDSLHTKEVIATSKTVFSITPIQSLGFVLNYIRLHVFKDNTAQLFGAIIDPKTYEQKITVSYTCTVSNDATQAGIMLYSTEA